MSSASAQIQAFHEPVTGTISYVVYDHCGGHAAIIDPVLDYDPKAGRTSTRNADQLIAFLQAQQLTLAWILETHAHADHLSAAAYLKQQCGGTVAIGEHIRQVQAIFSGIFHFESSFEADGSQFDHLFRDGETFQIGSLSAQALFVPGHTPADMAYLVGDAVFVGDTLFMPDLGTARCDFPGGNAATLYQSAQRLLSLPGSTRLFMCHDYPPASREVQWETTVAEQRAANIHIRQGISQDEFVALREARDRTLDMPNLLLPSVQINIRAGEMPPVEADGHRYLRIPLNRL